MKTVIIKLKFTDVPDHCNTAGIQEAIDSFNREDNPEKIVCSLVSYEEIME